MCVEAIIHLSTMLWATERIQYTETDGKEEEGITLAAEAQTERRGWKWERKTNRERRLRGDDGSDETDGGCQHRRHGRRKVKKEN